MSVYITTVKICFKLFTMMRKVLVVKMSLYYNCKNFVVKLFTMMKKVLVVKMGVLLIAVTGTQEIYRSGRD